MKKKGFTLVELLAVIAILAILVIIALPNVMSLFNEAKKNSFANELKEIYKTAQNQWMTDSMINTSVKYYSRQGTTKIQCDGSHNDDELKLSGRTQLNYGIKIDKSGSVVSYYATDGTYFFEFTATDSAHGLKIENIDGINDTDPKVQTVAETKTLTCTSSSYSWQ